MTYTKHFLLIPRTKAIELENEEALEVIKKTETTQIHQIEAA